MRYSILEAKQIIKNFYLIFKTYKIRIPVLLNGGTGLGKSSIITQLGNELGLEVVNLKLGHIPEVIGGGVPKIEGDKFVLVPVKELARACEKPVLLFLDELSLGGDLKVALSLLFGGEVLGYALHPETYIVSACNSGTDYDTNVLPKQILARFSIINLAYSIDNVKYLAQEFPEFRELLTIISDQVVRAWSEEDTNEELEPVACPRMLEYALWVLKAHKDNLIENDLKVKMLSTLLPQKILNLIVNAPVELSDFIKIKEGKFDIKGDVNKIIILVEEFFENLEFSEKINILNFIASCNLIKPDVKSGLIKKLISTLTPEEKLKIFNEPVFGQIKKIISEFMP